jgi:hypothetical protein
MSVELVTVITNAETGESISRPLTADELEILEADQASQLNYELLFEAKAAARESALAKLAELGLTAEEIAAL